MGGRGAARYQKHQMCWRDELLSGAVSQLEAWLLSEQGVTQVVKQIPCINVVVPSYRCNVEMLRRITALDVTGCSASVHILVVVDDPNSTSLEDVQALEDWSPGHLVSCCAAGLNSVFVLQTQPSCSF